MNELKLDKDTLLYYQNISLYSRMYCMSRGRLPLIGYRRSMFIITYMVSILITWAGSIILEETYKKNNHTYIMTNNFAVLPYLCGMLCIFIAYLMRKRDDLSIRYEELFSKRYVTVLDSLIYDNPSRLFMELGNDISFDLEINLMPDGHEKISFPLSTLIEKTGATAVRKLLEAKVHDAEVIKNITTDFYKNNTNKIWYDLVFKLFKYHEFNLNTYMHDLAYKNNWGLIYRIKSHFSHHPEWREQQIRSHELDKIILPLDKYMLPKLIRDTVNECSRNLKPSVIKNSTAVNSQICITINNPATHVQPLALRTDYTLMFRNIMQPKLKTEMYFDLEAQMYMPVNPPRSKYKIF